MVPSTNSGMFDALDEFLGRFHCEEPGRRKHHQRPLFGHIYMPSYRLEGVSIVEHIRQSFEETAPLFFVTSKQEAQLGSGLQTDCQVPPVTMLYQELLQILRRDMDVETIEDWHFLPTAHNEHGRLPLTVVVVLQLDPTVPADCALSLACLVEWDGDFLSAFVASAQPSIPMTTVDLVAPGRSDSFSDCLVSEGKDDGGRDT
ncbi:Ff.00g079170.m01.CDS01 [Fusarium sp. VM40]|nr:Ff.00g079170.m01.CDS01 [Fusarium sp. VM40]